MKKNLMILFFLLGCSFAGFSQHVISGKAGINFGKVEFQTENLSLTSSEVKTVFGIEYDYLFLNNFYLGVFFDFGYSSKLWIIDENIDLVGSGFNITYAPTIGYKFGRKHFFGLQIAPLYFDHTFFSGTNEYYYSISETVNFTATTFGSNIRMNFQWGQDISKHGFYVGLFFPWHYSLSSIERNSINGKDISSRAQGFKAEIGYRISFTM